MRDLKLIRDTPGYLLASRLTHHRVTGATVELFQKFPKSRRPRWQRIACLTLSKEEHRALALEFATASAFPDAQLGTQP